MLIKLNKRRQRGIGLLELMLSLAIISVLLVMATRYYKSARQNQQVNDAISLVEAIIAASENWVIERDDYNGINISDLITAGYLPRGSNKDAWHGTATVSSGMNPNEITITFAGVPPSACLSLAYKLNNQTSHPASDPESLCSGDPAMFTAVF